VEKREKKRAQNKMVFSCELVLTQVSPSVLDLCQKSGWKKNWFSCENWSSHKFHPQFQICIKRQDENSHTGWWKKRESKTGTFSHELLFTQVSPPVLELCLPHSFYSHSYSPLNQKASCLNKIIPANVVNKMLITSFIKQYSISLTFSKLHSNWGWNWDLRGWQKTRMIFF
jgi:hypothetical protein